MDKSFTYAYWLQKHVFVYHNADFGLGSDLDIFASGGHTCRTLEDALLLAAAKGYQWVLDDRYQMDVVSWSRVINGQYDEQQVTMFTVGVPDWDPRPHELVTRTTNLRDKHSRHGGLYYIGEEVKANASLMPSRRLFGLIKPKDIWGYSDLEATTRRFPYPIIVLYTSGVDDYSQARYLEQSLVTLHQGRPKVLFVESEGDIFTAHKRALNKLDTMLPVLVLDADFVPNHKFFHLLEVDLEEEQYVNLWYVKSACNPNCYGHGSPKLFPRFAFDCPRPKLDVSMGLGLGVKVHPFCVGTHVYNNSEESTWRTAFREAYKLRKAIGESPVTHYQEEALERLTTWVTWPATDLELTDPPFIYAAVKGARLAVQMYKEGFAEEYINNYKYLHLLYESIKHRLLNEDYLTHVGYEL